MFPLYRVTREINGNTIIVKITNHKHKRIRKYASCSRLSLLSKSRGRLSLSRVGPSLSLSVWVSYGPGQLWTSTKWFITLPLGCHNHTGILIRFGCCLIKTLPGKPSETKPWWRKKSTTRTTPPDVNLSGGPSAYASQSDAWASWMYRSEVP